MSEDVDPFVYIDVVAWIEHRLDEYDGGKVNLVGTIAQDLGLETFPYKEREFYDKSYPYNNEVAKALSRLAKLGILKAKFKGNRWVFSANFIHEVGSTFLDEDNNRVYTALCKSEGGIITIDGNPAPNCPHCKTRRELFPKEEVQDEG